MSHQAPITPLDGASEQMLIRIARSLLPDFKVTDQDIYRYMFDYFHGKLDTRKGIALFGNFGAGKTTAFKVFHTYLKTRYPFTSNLFVISSIEDLISELNNQNWIDRVLTNNKKTDPRGGSYNDPKHVLINEFGFRYNIKNYGTDVNELIEAWIMKRYDIFQQFGKVVHITSNFNAKELEEKFHTKIVDRFREMFEVKEFKGESLRK